MSRLPAGFMQEMLRPWKLITFSIGLGLLIWGASYNKFSDWWDIGVSIVMAVLTYLAASWAIRVLIERRWKMIPLAVFYSWLSVDGSYWAWHSFMGDAMFRDGQWQTSLCLWLICGFLWLWNGSLKELLDAVLLSRRSV